MIFFLIKQGKGYNNFLWMYIILGIAFQSLIILYYKLIFDYQKKRNVFLGERKRLGR